MESRTADAVIVAFAAVVALFRSEKLCAVSVAGLPYTLMPVGFAFALMFTASSLEIVDSIAVPIEEPLAVRLEPTRVLRMTESTQRAISRPEVLVACWSELNRSVARRMSVKPIT